MKRKLIFITVLLFSLGVSVYAAENTAQMQQIDLTMTASTGSSFYSPRFYVNGVKHTFEEIQPVFELTDEITKKLFYEAKKVWSTVRFDWYDENEQVQKLVENFNRFVSMNPEARVKVIAALEKIRLEKEQERESKVRERNAHFESRKNHFIGGKLVCGYQFERPVGQYPNSWYASEADRELNVPLYVGFRYARFYGEGNIIQGFIFEAILGGLMWNRYSGGLNLMYGLKTGLCYMGFGGFFNISQSIFPYSKVISFDSGLMMVIGLELRGLGKTKFFIGLELKGTPFALVKRLPDTSRIRYLSIALEMGVGY